MKIVIINPNSSREMTESIAAAAEEFAAGHFETVTLATEGAPELYGLDHACASVRVADVRAGKGEEAYLEAAGKAGTVKLLRNIANVTLYIFCFYRYNSFIK